MQTFLPYEEFAKSAVVLDNRRLGKQRVETLQILQALLLGSRWVNHPAVKMWKEYEGCLLTYQVTICNHWSLRGFKDTCLEKTEALVEGLNLNYKNPPWLGSSDFHLAHQSNLLRKDFDWYSRFFTDVPEDLPYFWPSKELS